MIRRIITIMMTFGISIAVRANVICSSDSAPITIDLGVMYDNTTNQAHSIEWDAAWIGEDDAAEVVIADNGVEIKRATGSGVFEYTVKDYEPHILTYTTYIGGVAQEEVYTATFNAIDCEGMGVPGLQRVTFTGSAYDTSHIALGAEPIVTLDGEGMYTKRNRDVILTCVKNNQLTQLKQIVKSIDEHAFIIINDSVEVRGQGFQSLLDNN